ELMRLAVQPLLQRLDPAGIAQLVDGEGSGVGEEEDRGRHPDPQALAPDLAARRHGRPPEGFVPEGNAPTDSVETFPGCASSTRGAPPIARLFGGPPGMYCTVNSNLTRLFSCRSSRRRFGSVKAGCANRLSTKRSSASSLRDSPEIVKGIWPAALRRLVCRERWTSLSSCLSVRGASRARRMSFGSTSTRRARQQAEEEARRSLFWS